MFKLIDTDQAMIVQRGVFKPTQVYEGPDGGLYVKASGGFVRVRENGATSADAIKLHMLHRDGPIFKDQWGRLCTAGGDKRKPVLLAQDTDGRMLIENKG